MAQSKEHKGNAKIVPANPAGLFLPYQERWILDHSRLKLMEKARQIGLSWSTSYACVERTAEAGARHDQWVSSRDDLQARLFVEDCKMWGKVLQLAAEDRGGTGHRRGKEDLRLCPAFFLRESGSTP